jgi:hypothetical protein
VQTDGAKQTRTGTKNQQLLTRIGYHVMQVRGSQPTLKVKSRIRSFLSREELEQILNSGAGKVAAAVRRAVLSTNNKMVIITYLNSYNHENGRVWARAYRM